MHLLNLTEKNFNKNILKLSIPAAIENVLHMSVFISDTIMVGRLGTDAIAAVGLAGYLHVALHGHYHYTIFNIFFKRVFGSDECRAKNCGH